MAQTGYTPILLYASGTATNVPLAANMTSSASGAELALNYADGKLYYKNSAGVVTLLASTAGASGDVVGPASATDNALARFDLTTGKLIQNSVGILSDAGVLTGLTGLTSSGSITFSSLTFGRVTYAGTSGLLQDSANMTFNGTTLTVNDLTDSSLTAGRVTFAGTAGNLTDSANLTFNGTTLTANTLSLTNALTVPNGGTGLTSLTAGRIPYGAGTSALGNSSNFIFDGTVFGVGAAPISTVRQYIRGTGATSATWSLYIDNSTPANIFSVRDDGNVGIGLSSAAFKLQTSGVQNANDIVSTNSTTGASLRMQMIDAYAALFTTTSYPLTLGVNNAEAMRIGVATGGVRAVGIGYTDLSNVTDNGLAVLGSVGIGTNLGPTYLGTPKLTVYGNQASKLFALLRNDSASASASSAIALNAYGNTWGIECGSLANNSNSLTFQLDYAGTNQLKMTLDISGNLDIVGNGKVGEGQIVSDATVGVFGIYGGLSGGSTTSQLKFFGRSVSNTGITYEIARITGGSFSPGSAYSLDGGLQFSTASNNGANVLTLTERARIDASGSFLINATVANNSKFAVGTPGDVTSGTQSGTFVGLKSAYAGVTGLAQNQLAVYDTGTAVGAGGAISFMTPQGTGATWGASIMASKIASGTVNYGCDLLFFTRPAGATADSCGRFTSDSRFLVGATTNASTERVRFNNTGSNDVLFIGTAGAGTGIVIRTDVSACTAMYYITTSGQAGLISLSGNTTTYTSGSDYRLKDNVRPINSALTKVAAMKPVAFEWKDSGLYGESFLAHELAEICPQAVVGEKDAVDADGKPKYQSIDTSFLVATLTAAIQEQQAIIESLKARLDAANI